MARKKSYYQIRSGTGETLYLISKLDQDLEVQASYAIYESFDKTLTCNCPSRKRPCKHIGFLYRFHDLNKVDSGELFNPDTGVFLNVEQLNNMEFKV